MQMSNEQDLHLVRYELRDPDWSRKGPDWADRWRNELSPDQRCWTPNKVQQGRRMVTYGRQVRSAPPCPCPPMRCPSLGLARWDTSMELTHKLVSKSPTEKTQELQSSGIEYFRSVKPSMTNLCGQSFFFISSLFQKRAFALIYPSCDLKTLVSPSPES
ncbi:hypothetical protein RRG08_059817 [Elysia crispata]|uniref:Uncharacterized protein n=1 Tax=Elysia crispata TaxID=231223 RepID=A0AAE1EDS8_9GAST|nr:hypothetical protein RRG08_059817 [Elysia crispata]